MKLLKYTGHPFVDVGIATITAFAGKDHPSEVTDEELEELRIYIREKYVQEMTKNHVRAAFTNNSAYLQASYSKKPELRNARVTSLLNGQDERNPSHQRQCVFCGRPASINALMHHIPMLGAANLFNFYPEGQSGLPTCPTCMLAIQALPLGAIRSRGRVLIVHSNCEDFLLHFAWHSLERNRSYLQISGIGSLPSSRFPKTALMKRLEEIEERRSYRASSRPCSITAYHFINDIRGAADIDIYQLPMTIMSFLLAARTPTYRAAWDALVAKNWEISKEKSKSEDEEKGEEQRRNSLFEDIFALPDIAARFLRKYFLRPPLRSITNAGATEGRDTHAIFWQLTTLFLERVMNMDKTRIDAVQTLADQLVDYYFSHDSGIFKNVRFASNYSDLRRVLIKADARLVDERTRPLFTFKEYISVFEEWEDEPYDNWRLSRDLVIIRMLEQIYERNKDAPEVLELLDDEQDTEDNE